MATQILPNRARILAPQQRSFDLACAVILAYPKARLLDDPSRITWRQLVRAVTSGTFNLEEADAASSDADFLAKMRIALRETKEARVAIRIIVRCSLAGYAEVAKYEDEAMQLSLIYDLAVLVRPDDGPDDEAEQDERNRRHEQCQDRRNCPEDEYGHADDQQNREHRGTGGQANGAHRQADREPEQLHQQPEWQKNGPEHELQDEEHHADDGKYRQSGNNQPGQSNQLQHLYPQKTRNPRRKFERELEIA